MIQKHLGFGGQKEKYYQSSAVHNSICQIHFKSVSSNEANLVISELRHGTFGTGPTRNGRRVGGSPFTAIGPFAKISIKTMRFGNNQYPIVKGIKTESNDGTVQTFGMHQYERAGVRELVVPQGEHISGVKLRYGWFIDQLGFVTNTSRQLGPVGRTSGGHSETVPRNIDSGRTLISIEGELVNWTGTEIMTRLKFTFAGKKENTYE